MLLPDPFFPPLLTGHDVRAPERAFASAIEGARGGRLGAGDFVWGRNTAVVQTAVVLEPECTLLRSFQMAVLTEVAFAEALGAVCPPQVAVEFRWPGDILINGGVAGRVQLSAPGKNAAMAAFGDVPQWLIVGAEIVLEAETKSSEPGHRAHETALSEEGGGEVNRTLLIEAFAPRMMAWIHTWQEDGFRAIAEQWLFRAEGRDAPVIIGGEAGLVLGRDEDGGLIFKPMEGPVRIFPFAEHVVWSGHDAASASGS